MAFSSVSVQRRDIPVFPSGHGPAHEQLHLPSVIIRMAGWIFRRSQITTRRSQQEARASVGRRLLVLLCHLCICPGVIILTPPVAWLGRSVGHAIGAAVDNLLRPAEYPRRRIRMSKSLPCACLLDSYGVHSAQRPCHQIESPGLIFFESLFLSTRIVHFDVEFSSSQSIQTSIHEITVLVTIPPIMALPSF